MHEPNRRRTGFLLALLAVVACATAEDLEGDTGSDVGADQPPADAGCDPAACLRTCAMIGVAGGSCASGECVCSPGDAGTDVPVPDVGPDGSGCDPATCDGACRSIGTPGGNCESGSCRCLGGADADADADLPDVPPDVAPDDAVPDDAAPDDAAPDDAAPDDAAPDDAAPDDVVVDDAAVDDAAVDDAGVDDAGTDDSGTVVWGLPVCDTVETSIADRPFIGGARTTSRTLSVPALGNVRAVRLEVTVQPRTLILASLPFSDLEVSLTSPAGTRWTFWMRHAGDESGFPPAYQFHTPWTLPVWWDTPVGGSWTLTFVDQEMSGMTTTLSSWCIVPLDPAPYAATDLGARVAVCDSATHSITDYCQGDAPDPCREHPVRFEMQVPTLARASAAPTLRIEQSHPDATQLEIDLVSAGGTTVRVWNRTAGPMPTTISLPTLAGTWLTGRWALKITDKVQTGTGSLTRWCIEAN